MHSPSSLSILLGALLLSLSSSARALPVQVHDDVDIDVPAGYLSRTVYDGDGVMVQVNWRNGVLAGLSDPTGQPGVLDVRTSHDQGATWNPIYFDLLDGVQVVTGLSVDVASGYSDPAADKRVYIGMMVGVPVLDKKVRFQAGMVSGSYDQPWNGAEFQAMRRPLPAPDFSLQAFLSQDMRFNTKVDVAVMPHVKASPYGVALVAAQPLALQPYGMGFETDIELGYSWDLGKSFSSERRWIAGNDPCENGEAELESFARSIEGTGHPSLAYDRNNERLVLAYHGKFKASAGPMDSVVVATVDPVRHEAGKSSFEGCYFGLESNTGSKIEPQRNPMVATDDNLIAFTCLAGHPQVVGTRGRASSYKLRAFWGSFVYQPWQDAFFEVTDYYWMRRGFNDHAVSSADLELRGDKLHFTAMCVVDHNPVQPGMGILQFTSEMTQPSESTRSLVNDFPVSEVDARLFPTISITRGKGVPRNETVTYFSWNSGYKMDR